MRKRVRKNKSRKPKIELDRVLSVKGHPRSTRLGIQIQQCIDQWENIDQDFVIRINENAFVIRLKTLSFNETFRLKPLIIKSEVVLYGVYGHAEELDRDRYLGVVLLHVGDPYVHAYTYYVALSYTDKDDIRTKEPKLLYSDDYFRFFRMGIGTPADYLFGYKNRMPEHDEVGKSDGAAHIETNAAWKDGMV